MTKDFELQDAVFQKIRQKELHRNITISFTLGDFPYEFDIFYDAKLNEIFLSEIFHDTTWKVCPYCENSSLSCLVLKHFKEGIFWRLIQYPEIRLKWLTRKHATIEM